MFYNLLPSALQYLLTSYLLSHGSPTEPSLSFGLRHEYGLSNSSRTVFSDVRSAQFGSEVFSINTRKTHVHRPKSQAAFFSARLRGLQRDLEWDKAEVVGPDIHDRETLQLLAKMTNNAYTQPENKDWYDLGPDWNSTYPFGWEPDADGFRGQIFATPDNSTVIVSVKGTSAGWLVGGGGSTTRKDKLNDNLLFSCCCARVGPTWRPVCGCYEGAYQCDQGCLEQSLVEDSLFYPTGTNLYYNVSYMYPNSDIWVVGHSLGGSLASLIGVTFGVPVVAFEAPAERLAAQRLHLPSPPSTQHVTHVYHTADPIPMGTCNGVSSSCATVGFAMETRCHLGKVLRYDTVSKLGWTATVRNHGIDVIINDLLSFDWEDDDAGKEGGKKRTVPELTDETDCIDCYQWEFGNYRNMSSSTCGNSVQAIYTDEH